MGYMLKIGNSVVGFSSILVYLTGLISLLLIVQKKKVPRKLTIAVVGMILILGLGACRNIILPYKKSVVTGNWTDYVLGKNVESYISGQSLQIGYYLVLSFIGLILIASDILLDEYDFWDVLADVIKCRISNCCGCLSGKSDGRMSHSNKNLIEDTVVTGIHCHTVYI